MVSIESYTPVYVVFYHNSKDGTCCGLEPYLTFAEALSATKTRFESWQSDCKDNVEDPGTFDEYLKNSHIRVIPLKNYKKSSPIYVLQDNEEDSIDEDELITTDAEEWKEKMSGYSEEDMQKCTFRFS